MHVPQTSAARRRCRLLPVIYAIPTMLLCLAAAGCAGSAETVMAPPDPNNTLARPPEGATGSFCASLTPAQRAGNQLCGAPSAR